MMPTIKTLEEAARAANDKKQYRGLNKKEGEAQKERARHIFELLSSARIMRMLEK